MGVCVQGGGGVYVHTAGWCMPKIVGSTAPCLVCAACCNNANRNEVKMEEGTCCFISALL